MISLDPQRIRRLVLEQSKRAGVGHIGSALSVVEILCALYGPTLRVTSPFDPNRDRFVLSKGHAALALYAVLYLKGWIGDDVLSTFGTNGTLLGVHPDHRVTGIDFSTGSMGMGLGFAAGAALAAKVQRTDRRAFALLSDGECNEGSVWEAAMFAAHHGLANLTAVIDCNRQQAFGFTSEVLRDDAMPERWRSFGWDVHEVDGHSVEALSGVLERLNYSVGKPHVIVARTVSGKGVSYMEGKIKWHYWPMNEDEYQRALAEVGEVR